MKRRRIAFRQVVAKAGDWCSGPTREGAAHVLMREGSPAVMVVFQRPNGLAANYVLCGKCVSALNQKRQVGSITRGFGGAYVQDFNNAIEGRTCVLCCSSDFGFGTIVRAKGEGGAAAVFCAECVRALGLGLASEVSEGIRLNPRS